MPALPLVAPATTSVPTKATAAALPTGKAVRSGDPPSRMAVELSNYIRALPNHVDSCQRVFAAEYNTYEKAKELQMYYANRPALLEYTLEKEVPRMDYTVVCNGLVANDKSTVQQMLRDHDTTNSNGASSNSNSEICSRCANQSLLADVLQVMMGHDRVVRPQYMAVAVASKCQFYVDLDASIVEATATIDLSLPLPDEKRWKVAEIQVVVVFKPEQLSVNFRVTGIRLIRHDNATGKIALRDCSSLLETMLLSDEKPHCRIFTATANTRCVRDRLLNQSRNVLQASAAGAVQGMKSAWQDIDANISCRIQTHLANENEKILHRPLPLRRRRRSWEAFFIA